MEVEIVSTEHIKPSSPTPLHLKTYKICLLDQATAPAAYIPLAFYYPNPNPTNQEHTNDLNSHLQILKQSLSETLTLFYPFAGKVKDNLSIDCNDDGAHFIIAQVKDKISLNAFLTNPNVNLNSKFLPGELGVAAFTSPGSNILMIQVTTFLCGGIVVGLRLAHMITDGKGMSMFLKTWAAIAKKNNTQDQEGVVSTLCPNFDVASSLFPQIDSFPSEATDVSFIFPFLRKGKGSVTRIVFDSSSLATLKAEIKATNSSSSTRVLNPTSVEVVTALLFKSIMRVIKAKSSNWFKPICLDHLVNLRPRAMPPLPENSMGNFLGHTLVLCTDEEPELHDLVWKWREALAKLNNDFVKNIQGDGGLVKFCEATDDIRRVYSDAKERVGFSSWRHFGLYDIDFGWGKPIWMSCHSMTEKDNDFFFYFNALMDTRLGDGIEAWVYVDEQGINILHNDKELLGFAKLDPSPLP